MRDGSKSPRLATIVRPRRLPRPSAEYRCELVHFEAVPLVLWSDRIVDHQATERRWAMHCSCRAHLNTAAMVTMYLLFTVFGWIAGRPRFCTFATGCGIVRSSSAFWRPRFTGRRSNSFRSSLASSREIPRHRGRQTHRAVTARLARRLSWSPRSTLPPLSASYSSIRALTVRTGAEGELRVAEGSVEGQPPLRHVVRPTLQPSNRRAHQYDHRKHEVTAEQVHCRGFFRQLNTSKPGDCAGRCRHHAEIIAS